MKFRDYPMVRIPEERIAAKAKIDAGTRGCPNGMMMLEVAPRGRFELPR